MNKRHKKKFINKCNMKTYLNSRRIKITVNANKCIPENQRSSNNIIYIIDSRKTDLKHPKKVTLLTNCYPIAMN